jgi:hypothetical protein
MPSIRIGFSTDFNLTSEQVGIGTTLPSARLDVAGQILSDNSSGSGGVSTVTRYDGFLGSEQRLSDNISIDQTSKGNLNSLSGEIILDNEITVTDGTPLTGGRLDSLTVTGAFDLPHGGTASRQTTPEKGSTRFNQDLGQLEFYTGTEWRTTLSYDGSGRGRGVIGGGYVSSPGFSVQSIEFITIATTGNGQSFGDLTLNRNQLSSCASETRGLFGGGSPSGADAFNTIDYITIASSGNAIDFGDLYVNAQSRNLGAISSSTRGIWAGGANPVPGSSVQINIISYIQIGTLGNSIDFGDLTSARRIRDYRCSSPTRGIFGSGTPGSGYTKSMDFITISSTGNAVTFGDMLFSGGYGGGCANNTRGLFGGGNSPTYDNTIQFITIATTGNATDFGDLTLARQVGASCSSSTRGIFAGGATATGQNIIEYVSISTFGNAQDFGDLSIPRELTTACSDSHGGLGGF